MQFQLDARNMKSMRVHRHLDADEAVVRGAALYAANLSTTFRLNRKFGMTDGVVYPVSFKVCLRQSCIWRSMAAPQLGCAGSRGAHQHHFPKG